MNKNPALRNTIRFIALSVVFALSGRIVNLLLIKGFNIELSKPLQSILIFVITSVGILFFFPGIFGSPFGKISIGEWLKRLGVYKPHNLTGHILLGILLGVVSLTGMLLGSLFTGKYHPDISNINAGHLLFSLTPAIWEEVLFRGVVMMLLIQYLGNIQKAFWWQILIFALCHLNGFNLVSFIEIISVALIAFTFSLAAVKTRTLIAGIIYHYIHDAFLLFFQLPDGEYHGFVDNFTFYAFFWSAMLVNMLLILLFTEKTALRGQHETYSINGITNDMEFITGVQSQSQKKSKIQRALLLLNIFVPVTQLTERLDSGHPLIIVLLITVAVLNLLAYIFYYRVGYRIIVMTFLINGVCNLVSGYDSFLQGSQRAYIIVVLTGILYFILALFYLVMGEKHISKQKMDTENKTTVPEP
ncbi:MAG: CPBP family intramembrane metalloprotease [Bacteroidales bacterium]|nr:CPBP family intramembrane metalloprotease [Bacteroidales bacterium]